jgi:hypothetical protein
VIQAPDAGAPARTAPGEILEVVARLRLPLTPPPGVQQPRVWSGWSVGLRRAADLAAAGAAPVIEVRLRPLRLRPAGGDRYRLSAVVPRWVLSGSYDLLLHGPGVADEVPGAVIVGGGPPRDAVDAVLPAGAAGFAATLDGRPLRAQAVSFSRFDGETGAGSGRVVRLELPAPDHGGAEPDPREAAARIAFAEAPQRPCGARIELLPDAAWPAAGCLGVAAWAGDPEAVSVLWEIGSRATTDGPRARLSCVADPGTVVRATGFDGSGRPCRAERRIPVRDPRSAAGCGCRFTARGGAGPLSILRHIFFLSRPAAREYDAARRPFGHGALSMKGDQR